MTFLYFALIKSYEFLFRFLTRHGINLNNQTNNNQNIYFSLRCADRFRNKFRHFLIERPQRQHFEILREAAYNWATANRLESIISYCIENGYPLSILSLEVPTYDTDYITAYLFLSHRSYDPFFAKSDIKLVLNSRLSLVDYCRNY